MTSKKKLLLHACCGPCTVYPYDIIKDTDQELTFFYYNPNIHPAEEYLRRKDTLANFAAKNSIPLITKDPDMDGLSSSERQKLWISTDEKNRCGNCYKYRLDATARYAAENGYDSFSTSLLVSIYQDHDRIIDIANECAARYAVGFYYHDFREGFRSGQQKARELGMYRQKFCGCIVSLSTSMFRDKIMFSLNAAQK